MCGQVGVILGIKRRRRDEIDYITWAFTRMLEMSEERGPHATGMAWVNRDGDAIIPRSQLSVDAGARQGARRSEEFVSTADHTQRFALCSTSIAHGSVQIRVGADDWEEARFFIDSAPDSKHFQVETDGLDVTWIVFGDGIHGAIPLAGEIITVEYLETLGSEGNIGRELVTEIVSPIYHNGTRIDLVVTNPIASTGGSDRETLEHAKLQAPAELRSLWKAVTKDDYRALAEGFESRNIVPVSRWRRARTTLTAGGLGSRDIRRRQSTSMWSRRCRLLVRRNTPAAESSHARPPQERSTLLHGDQSAARQAIAYTGRLPIPAARASRGSKRSARGSHRTSTMVWMRPQPPHLQPRTPVDSPSQCL